MTEKKAAGLMDGRMDGLQFKIVNQLTELLELKALIKSSYLHQLQDSQYQTVESGCTKC